MESSYFSTSLLGVLILPPRELLLGGYVTYMFKIYYLQNSNMPSPRFTSKPDPTEKHIAFHYKRLALSQLKKIVRIGLACSNVLAECFVQFCVVWAFNGGHARDKSVLVASGEVAVACSQLLRYLSKRQLAAGRTRAKTYLGTH